MEKVKISGSIHPQNYYYEWQLTNAEKNKIRHILKDEAPKKKIESFIHYLQGLCELKKFLLEQPQRSEVRLTRERILTDCKAALGHLKQCAKGQSITWYDEKIDPLWSYQPEQKKVCLVCNHPFTTSNNYREKCIQCDPSDPTPVKTSHKDDQGFLVQVLDSSWIAVGPLEKFIKVLEKYHEAENIKIGRPKADSDNFIRKIREIYTEHIGIPTSYENGPFFEVVQAVREMFDLPYEDPSRAIKAALTNK